MFDLYFLKSNLQNEEFQGQDRGRSLSVVENSRLDGQVGLVLKKRPEEHGEVAEDDDR